MKSRLSPWVWVNLGDGKSVGAEGGNTWGQTEITSKFQHGPSSAPHSQPHPAPRTQLPILPDVLHAGS